MKKILLLLILFNKSIHASENLLVLVDEINFNEQLESDISKLQEMNLYSEIFIDRKTNDTKEILEKMKILKSSKAISIDSNTNKNIFTKYNLAGENKIIETNKNENIVQALNKFSTNSNPSDNIAKEIKPDSNKNIYYYILGGSLAILGTGLALYAKSKKENNSVSFSLN
jgi:hypothetical protein